MEYFIKDYQSFQYESEAEGEVMHKRGCASSHTRNGDLTVGKEIRIHADPELGLTEHVSAACACSVLSLSSTTYKTNPVMKADHLIMQSWKGLIHLISLAYKCTVGLP